MVARSGSIGVTSPLENDWSLDDSDLVLGERATPLERHQSGLLSPSRLDRLPVDGMPLSPVHAGEGDSVAVRALCHAGTRVARPEDDRRAALRAYTLSRA